jgi:hypothetical protein
MLNLKLLRTMLLVRQNVKISPAIETWYNSLIPVGISGSSNTLVPSVLLTTPSLHLLHLYDEDQFLDKSSQLFVIFLLAAFDIVL